MEHIEHEATDKTRTYGERRIGGLVNMEGKDMTIYVREEL